MTSRPNIVVMLADDMGFSDLGCYGSEIETPNLDRLAAAGVRMSQFYNTARCTPARASLLTGLHPHQAGIGVLTQPQEPLGYAGRLNERCVTMAEVLRAAGDEIRRRRHDRLRELGILGDWPAAERAIRRYPPGRTPPSTSGRRAGWRCTPPR